MQETEFSQFNHQIWKGYNQVKEGKYANFRYRDTLNIVVFWSSRNNYRIKLNDF